MRLKPLLILLFVLSSLLPDAVWAQFSSVRIQVIDVGQGDGILIRTPNQRWILIDAGTNSQIAGALGPEWGVDRLTLAIVSHRHFDHHGGMDNVLNAVPVDRFLGVTEDCPNRVSDDTVRSVISSRNIPVAPLDVGSIVIDGVTLTILPLPPRSRCPEHENNNSIVVRLDFGEFSMLFPGDAEEDERDWLVANHVTLLDVDVLKASHHGSHNGTSGPWLNAITPLRVVISAGVNATYQHPHRQAVLAYNVAANVYCTNRHGTVRVYGFADGRIRVSRQRRTDKSCVYDGTHY
jgi:competence protein ComEC